MAIHFKRKFFNNVLRDEAPPGGGREAGGGTSPGFARGLQEILNLFNPAHAISGDAVYSQEALDQIITNLMEAHPQSNAAPPASTEALANLNRRPVDASMLDGESKTECTICIDDMKVLVDQGHHSQMINLGADWTVAVRFQSLALDPPSSLGLQAKARAD
ncbi:hypothetical protein TASIC1_0003004100 [Trichoderma asperellum]|uniref:Uncharacterized protein n=1 Tax=Trichoderma asperellum TaxID=101201 RepID=A0A6V8QTC2_TRIAP|nr:hypothetical protein TASIC1_0003004100 [Trichoderma asperellum]